MKDVKKPLKSSESRIYTVLFNGVQVNQKIPNLEEAIKFSYGLHIATLVQSHAIEVFSEPDEKVTKRLFASFLTGDYYDGK